MDYILSAENAVIMVLLKKDVCSTGDAREICEKIGKLSGIDIDVYINVHCMVELIHNYNTFKWVSDDLGCYEISFADNVNKEGWDGRLKYRLPEKVYDVFKSITSES